MDRSKIKYVVHICGNSFSFNDGMTALNFAALALGHIDDPDDIDGNILIFVEVENDK